MKKLPLKALCFLFIHIFCITTLTGQDATDNLGLIEQFKNKENFEKRFDFFFNLPNRYSENSEYDWLQIVNVYLNNAEKTKDSAAVKEYKLMQSQLYYDLGDYDRSLAISKEIYGQKQGIDLETRSVLLDLMDKTYSKMKLYVDQIEIREEKKDSGLSEDVIFHDIYSNLGLHREAMTYYMLEEKKNVDEKDYYAQAVFYNNVGTYLRLDKSYPAALTNYKKAEGFLNLYLSDVTKQKSEKNLIETGTLKATILGNQGKCYVRLGQYESAIPFLEESIDIFKERKGQPSSELVENTLEIADCYLRLGDLKKTTDFLSNDLTLVGVDNLIKKNQLLASYYDKTGNYQAGYSYLKRNVRILDSIKLNETEITKKQLAEVMAKETEYNKNKIEQQEKELEESKNEMVAKDREISFVFVSLIFTLLGFAGLVYAYLRSIKSQRLIAEQKHIIENALVEKDSLLKEIHHRVKNNLQMVSSLLSLQTKNTRSKAAIEALEEGKSRVKAMALIHQKLYQHDDLSVIEMQGYIESLINSIQSVYKKGGHDINITIDAEGVELDIDRAIPFGLILNELVSNSFKYAFPTSEDNGKIYIHLRQIANQEGFFEYTDNGVGLPDDTDERANSSMGIRLMNRLVNQLQSTLNIDKTAEGVRFWFHFK
ncbi:MAG: histidine kinase dimerization/phosphoacceptor domain -containing protein [Flavobacteriaceae bacterium]